MDEAEGQGRVEAEKLRSKASHIYGVTLPVMVERSLLIQVDLKVPRREQPVRDAGNSRKSSHIVQISSALHRFSVAEGAG